VDRAWGLVKQSAAARDILTQKTITAPERSQYSKPAR